MSTTTLTLTQPLPAFAKLSHQELVTINMAMNEFFTPPSGEYSGFDPELLKGASEQMLSNGLHAVVWPGSCGEGGRSVLLVHGWGGYSAQLSEFVRPLLAAGMRVVAVDMWAHGLSPGVESNCIKFAQGIAQAQAELGPFDHAIGHSLGAAAILTAAYFGVKFKSAVLIAPPSILLIMQKFFAHKGGAEHLLETFIQMSERYVGRLRTQSDSLLISKHVSMPMLLIHDEMDKRCTPKVSEQLARDGANRKLMLTHGYGHQKIIRAPEVIAAAVDYLAPVQSAAA